MNIIFDLDGTLFQTRLCTVNAVRQLFYDHKWEQIESERIIHNIGKTSMEFLSAIIPSGVSPEDVYCQFSAYERDEIKRNAILFDGIDQLLSDLCLQGNTLFLCSTGSEEYMELVLDKTGIRKYFNQLCSAKCVSKTSIVKQLVDDDHFALVIGDTISDFQAAVDNQVPSIGVEYGYGKSEDLLLATYVAADAKEIISFINQIKIYHILTQKIDRYGKRVLGINGVDTSGKSTFTNRFTQYLTSVGKKVEIIHIDDFHNPYKIRMTGKDEIHAYYDNAFNYNQLVNEILEPLHKEGQVHKKVACLNLDTDQYENEIEFDITSDTIVLIEGVLLFRDPVNQYIDYKVYIHIDFDEVLKRAEIRDVPKYGAAFLEKYKNKYIPVQKIYLLEKDPMHKCDMVINNENYLDPVIMSY